MLIMSHCRVKFPFKTTFLPVWCVLMLSRLHCTYSLTSIPSLGAPQAALIEKKTKELRDLLQQAQARIQQERIPRNAVPLDPSGYSSTAQSERLNRYTTDTTPDSAQALSKQAAVSDPFVDIPGVWNSITTLHASGLNLTEVGPTFQKNILLECLGDDDEGSRLTSDQAIYSGGSSGVEVLRRMRAFLEKFSQQTTTDPRGATLSRHSIKSFRTRQLLILTSIGEFDGPGMALLYANEAVCAKRDACCWPMLTGRRLYGLGGRETICNAALMLALRMFLHYGL